MSELFNCKTCHRDLSKDEFIKDEKQYKTCNICRDAVNSNRRKHICQVCGIKGVFNIKGEITGIRCKTHKELNMIDATRKKCQVCKKKQPAFNLEGETIATHCADCKEVGMIDIKSKKCQVCKKKQPAFNLEGETIATHCGECKEVGMIDIKHKKCQVCKKTRPTFNLEGESIATHCGKCKEVGMIDIKHKKCQIENCNTRSSYGYLNQKLSRCGKHKLPLMFKKTQPICNYENCKEIAEYGLSEPLHCEFHKSNNELHLVGTTCKECNRDNELCNNEGLCLTYCRPNEIYQNAKQYIKKKESYVLAYLDKNNTFNRKPIDDSIIDSSCVRRRPDRVYDLGFVYLIIEIDEFQHSSYYSVCVFDKDTQELRRMVQISEALSMNQIPCIFIRFNPDEFSVDGKKQKVNMAKRLEILKKWIEYIQKMKPEDFENEMEIQIKYLFYNEYKEEDLSFQKITEEMMKKMIIH